MDPIYFPSSDRPHASSFPVLATAYLVCLVSANLPAAIPYRTFLPLPCLLYLLYFARTHDSGNVGETYLLPLQLVSLFWHWIIIFIDNDPQKSILRLKEDGKLETPEEVAKLSTTRKALRSLSLLTSVRGAGWNWEVKNIDPVRERSKGQYLRARLFDFIRAYLFADLTSVLVLRKMKSLDPQAFSSWTLTDQIVVSWLSAFNNGYSMSMAYQLAALLTVSTGLDKPSSYPPINGTLSGCYTIRKVWGYGWHQMLRKRFEITTDFLVHRVLRVKAGGFFSRYGRLFATFFLSALLHFMGTLNVPYVDGGVGNWWFFMSQPVGVCIEDAATAIGSRLGFRKSKLVRMIGFLWVVVWFSWTSRFASIQNVPLKTYEIQNPLIVFSVTEWLLDRSW